MSTQDHMHTNAPLDIDEARALAKSISAATGEWVADRVSPLLATLDWSRESAEAFTTLVRDFKAHWETIAPGLDPLCLPWFIISQHFTCRAPSDEEVEAALDVFDLSARET